MITLLIIGILVLAVKLICFTVGAAWGILKAVVTVLCLPIVLLGLIIAGLFQVAVPLLIIALAVAFIWPRVRNRIAENKVS